MFVLFELRMILDNIHTPCSCHCVIPFDCKIVIGYESCLLASSLSI